MRLSASSVHNRAIFAITIVAAAVAAADYRACIVQKSRRLVEQVGRLLLDSVGSGDDVAHSDQEVYLGAWLAVNHVAEVALCALAKVDHHGLLGWAGRTRNSLVDAKVARLDGKALRLACDVHRGPQAGIICIVGSVNSFTLSGECVVANVTEAGVLRAKSTKILINGLTIALVAQRVQTANNSAVAHDALDQDALLVGTALAG